jgi:hypothetical protein|tara:strand:+ start:872 stop:1129 length:258 start_codon:yes stop_codon:yes gene_type:complete
MIKIENLTININKVSVEQEDDNELLDSEIPAVVRDELVSTLRIISEDSRFSGQTVVIPDGCEQYGFAEGEFDLPQLLAFLADMLE